MNTRFFKHIAMITLSLILSSLVTSCELKRSNPLDPNNNQEITAPPQVTGLTASGSGAGVLNKYVQLTWTKNIINTDGYYIYMGLAYNSAYAKIDTLVGNLSTSNNMTRIIPISTPGFYYFKVSAYKSYPAGNLEGTLSEWAIANVQN
jgi:hypothetical protein